MKRSYLVLAVTVGLLHVLSPIISSASEVDGVLSLSPIGDHSCIAVHLDVPSGVPVAGVSWYHNDASVNFPTLLIVEGDRGVPPDLSNTAVIVASIGGESLAWGSVTLPTPVLSESRTLYAVFELPEQSEHVGEGYGGGPALGFRYGAGASTSFASPDGEQWVRLRSNVDVAVEPVVGMNKGVAAPSSASALRAARGEGWWDHAGDTSDVAEEVGSGANVPEPSPLTSISARPNPFNPRTTIEYSVARPGHVAIDIFDSRGRLVRKLHSRSTASGRHEIVWDGQDDQGRRVGSGVYHVRLEAPGTTLFRRIALVR